MSVVRMYTHDEGTKTAYLTRCRLYKILRSYTTVDCTSKLHLSLCHIRLGHLLMQIESSMTDNGDTDI